MDRTRQQSSSEVRPGVSEGVQKQLRKCVKVVGMIDGDFNRWRSPPPTSDFER
jgi:hypothetical protein